MSRVPSGQRTLTVYFDGSCPLGRAEIDYYSRQEGTDALCFCDVSEAVPQDLTQQQAMARFHVRDDEGVLVSGAAAFVSIWRSSAEVALGRTRGVPAWDDELA